MKWYNVELPYNTREAIRRADNFKSWLNDNGYKHETSGAGDHVHFEVLLSVDDLEAVNGALDCIVWFDAITAA